MNDRAANEYDHCGQQNRKPQRHDGYHDTSPQLVMELLQEPKAQRLIIKKNRMALKDVTCVALSERNNATISSVIR
jgi:hypothetical protein